MFLDEYKKIISEPVIAKVHSQYLGIHDFFIFWKNDLWLPSQEQKPKLLF